MELPSDIGAARTPISPGGSPIYPFNAGVHLILIIKCQVTTLTSMDLPNTRINDGAVLVAILPPPGLLQTAFPGLVDFDFRRSDRNKLFASFIAKAF